MLAIVFALLPFPSIRTYGPLYQITLILLPALFSLGVSGKLYFAGKLPLISAIMLVAANSAISVVHFAIASAIAPT
jgi:hypothetical protein